MSTYALAELANGIIVSRILTGKLVARETDDLQTLIGVLLVQLLELGKLRSVTALGSGVDDEDDLALELVESVLLIGGLLGLEIVEGDHLCAFRIGNVDAWLDGCGGEERLKGFVSNFKLRCVQKWSDETKNRVQRRTLVEGSDKDLQRRGCAVLPKAGVNASHAQPKA